MPESNSKIPNQALIEYYDPESLRTACQNCRAFTGDMYDAISVNTVTYFKWLEKEGTDTVEGYKIVSDIMMPGYIASFGKKEELEALAVLHEHLAYGRDKEEKT